MGIAEHLTCLLRNLYAGQEATVGTGHGTTDWFQIGKGVRQGCILSPCLLNLYAEYTSIHLLSPLVAQRVKRLPAVPETRVRSLGWEDPLEKEMATHSSVLAWTGRESLVGCCLWGHKELDPTEQLHFHFHFHPPTT